MTDRCSQAFIGRWALTAEDTPYVIFDMQLVARGSIGEVVLRDKVYGSLHSTSATGPMVALPLSATACGPSSVDVSYDRNKDKIRFRIARHPDGRLSAEMLDLPPGVSAPILRLVPVGPKIVPAEFSEVRQRDEIGSNVASNEEMARIFNDDQATREELSRRGRKTSRQDKASMERWRNSDAKRLSQTRQLIREGKLRTGLDYWRAAFIFQHGGTPSNYLYAHHLANVALKLGYRDAAWIAAATLDRYLLSIGQPQIYGTQFETDEAGQRKRQSLKPDFMNDEDRAVLDVPPLSAK
ncbi:MAG: hypothetical protein H0W65_07760 [Sphingomonas sp.]|uniref:hypothetical protein n=1 Tax=Sphingomonas sp. TaxID=28214 RepID=UPI0017B77369|nr:hypothetical protein [Sphingomonas sp.]MBA3667602.1 hypothetical protein [Sphingomonas sp.]